MGLNIRWRLWRWRLIIQCFTKLLNQEASKRSQNLFKVEVDD